MAEAKTLSVNPDQLRSNAVTLRDDTSAAMSQLDQISQSTVSPGFTSLAGAFGDVAAAGAAMTSAWATADAALQTRLTGTADGLEASAQLYQDTDAAGSGSLTLNTDAQAQ